MNNKFEKLYPSASFLKTNETEDGHVANFRLKCATVDEFKEWLQHHQQLSGVTYRVRTTTPCTGKKSHLSYGQYPVELTCLAVGTKGQKPLDFYSFFMVTGGAITQALEQAYGSRTQWEFGQLGKLAVIGKVIGLEQHYLYMHADHRWPSHKPAPMIKKLLFDHTIITNITLITFFTGLNLMDGVHPYHILDELIDKYWITYPVDVGISLPTQLYNFYYLPAKHRVLFVAAVSMVTSVALTFLKDIETDKLVIK